MKRSAIIRRTPLRPGKPNRRWVRAEEDKVSGTERLYVLTRDQGCVAPRLGGTAHDCWGRVTLAHVKDAPRMGVRAESGDGEGRRHLVSVCEGHSEAGMRAGFIWVTHADNIAEMRRYLAEREPG